MTQPVAAADAASTYDAIPYESNPFGFTSPEHLASIAGLFGLPAVDPAHCRVLELGCASGGNLLPLAALFPDSRFVGIDASAAQVADGQAQVAELGLGNISLETRDIMTLAFDGEPFDYIICHGVYSWVPLAVQHSILELCRTLTHRNSVCYVSYNTYPGWHLRGSVREMMNYHARGFDNDRERIGQARALLNMLVEAAPADNAYGQLLREELNILRERADSYLFHEHLETNNTPLYFHEFAERVEAAGLRYLGEASISSMLPHGFSPEIRETLARIAPDIIRHEQYLDFLRNRTFRRTLLCHADTELDRDIGAKTIADYRVSALLRHVQPAPDEEAVGRAFSHITGIHVTAHAPIEQSVLSALADNMPCTLSIAELTATARRDCGIGEEDSTVMEQVGSLVLECAANGLAELHRYPDRYTIDFGAQPCATDFARWQVGKFGWATNQRHNRVDLAPFEAALLTLVDGTRDRAALSQAMHDKVLSGALHMFVQGERVQTPEEIDELMPGALDLGLRRLAGNMLLIA